MPCPPAGLRQIDTAEKQHEFFVAEGDFVAFFARFRPPETSLLQALGAWDRWVFRRAMEGVLPAEIQWRPKKGNLSPNFHRRLLDFERQRLEEVIFGGGRQLQPYVDSSAMIAAYREYQKNHVKSQGESMQIFAAVNLALWLRSSGFSSS